MKTKTKNKKTTSLPKENCSISEDLLKFRNNLTESFENSPLPQEELMFNLGMYTRSSVLVKFLVVSDLYKRILDIPGNIYEFGTWWGQNMILCENLRAIYEPFNKQRHIIGFDTFSGYNENKEWYSTSKNYKKYLQDLLEAHEGSNVLGHIRGQHSLIEGDVCKTVPQHFKNNKNEIVALAYLDIGTYDTTKAILTSIKPNLVKGSIILLDQFSWKDMPGEAVAFKETFKNSEYKIEKCNLYPSKAIVTIL